MSSDILTRTNSVLKEEIPIELLHRWRDASLFFGRTILVGILVCSFPFPIVLLWLLLLGSSVWVQVIGIFVAAIGAIVIGWWLYTVVDRFWVEGWLPESCPVVETDGRAISVRWGDYCTQADIKDCQYRLGSPWQMKRNALKTKRSFPFGEQNVILIDLPVTADSFYRRTTVAVGYTDQTKRQWAELLQVQDLILNTKPSFATPAGS